MKSVLSKFQTRKKFDVGSRLSSQTLCLLVLYTSQSQSVTELLSWDWFCEVRRTFAVFTKACKGQHPHLSLQEAMRSTYYQEQWKSLYNTLKFLCDSLSVGFHMKFLLFTPNQKFFSNRFPLKKVTTLKVKESRRTELTSC